MGSRKPTDAVSPLVERALPVVPKPRPGVGPLRADPGSSWRSEFDAEDLALPSLEAKALVGDVERPVGTDRHTSRERQA
jgi:hypothetical protein